jgi:hypothetical protein
MIPFALPARREYLAFPNSLWLLHKLEVICYFAGRLFGRGFLLVFFLLERESTSPG